MSELTPRQARFVEEFLVDLNATQAAVRAGYSARTAYAQGQRLLKNVEVEKAIRAAQAARSQRTEISQDRVLLELARVAFGDPRRVMSWGPKGVELRPSSALTDDEAAIVAEVSETTSEGGGSIRLKTVSKMEALRLLGQHLGMFPDKLNLKASVGLGEEWQAIQALILRALEAFPDAKLALAEALAKAESDAGPGR